MEHIMKNTISERYFFLQFVTESDSLFKQRADRFAFLNAWRACFAQKIKTCAYVLIPGRFGVIISVQSSEPVSPENMLSYVCEKLRSRFVGVLTVSELEVFLQRAYAEELSTEKECIYRAFDIHTMPQRYHVSTDYRSYPFSSFLALSTGRPSSVDQKTVWNWFGGRMRFSLFHQAYYGWVQPDAMLDKAYA